MENWLDVFDDKDWKEIEQFLKTKLKDCGKNLFEMEYALHKIIEDAVYDYELDTIYENMI